MTRDGLEVIDQLAAAEASLAQIEDDQLADAWQWARDVQALAKARKLAADISLRAKRIEARILRRMGPQDDMHSTARFSARHLSEMSDFEFGEFLASLGDSGSIYGDVRRWVTDAEEEARRKKFVERASQGWADKYEHREHVTKAAATVLQEVFAERESVSTADAIEVLADVCGVDADTHVVRVGLQNMLSRLIGAADTVADEDRHTHWEGDGAVPPFGKIPTHVTYQIDGVFMRSAWSAATISQLAYNVEMVERQAAERLEAAEAMRGLLEQLRAVPLLLDMPDVDDSAKASDVLMLGRINGLIGAPAHNPDKVNEDEAQRRFPRLFKHADNYHFVVMALARIARRLTALGIENEAQLIESGAAETLAETQLFTGTNRRSMEHYAAAYAPALIGTFGYYWEVVGERIQQAS